MVQDLIRYDLLAQDALRGLVRKVLSDAAKFGLPGEHHFYVSFDTRAPGVRISQRLREKYPEEMTVVLQHQFWDLTVTDQTFEVGLSFGNVPERLLVPFSAIKGFFDPSVQFGLQFEVAAPEASGAESRSSNLPAHPEERHPPRGARSEPTEMPPQSRGGAGTAQPEPQVPKAGQAPDGKGQEKQAAEVVSLDAFRKK